MLMDFFSDDISFFGFVRIFLQKKEEEERI